MILLAVIATAHGIRGAVKVKTFTQNPENIFTYGALKDEKGRTYQLKLVRLLSSDSLIASVEGIVDRNQAEALRGTKLYIERLQLPDLVEEEFYHSDLIGLKVLDLEGQDVGYVQAIGNYGAGDYIEILDESHHLFTIPFTREAVPIVRLPKGDEEGGLQVDRRFLLDSTLKNTDESPDQEEPGDKK
ncbi:MAG: ribosome maturation factor RimM [Alphaproteobacteria bacterium]|jgi:16S rRNA processing protein RimM|nr:ribosome maturation factor RimM [Alphaproteobacteria bacterium]